MVVMMVAVMVGVSVCSNGGRINVGSRGGGFDGGEGNIRDAHCFFDNIYSTSDLY